DGITEELTDALGQNAALRVIAWDTASGFRSLGLSAVEIGKRLDVASVLHGSIERMGDEVRVRAELVDATSGYQLWSAHYDASFENIFAVQDRITQAIAAALKVKFAKSDLVAGGTRNPKAHELVLKGRALVNRLDNASLVAAQKDFEEAIALDPDYADAHALLGRALLLQTEASNQSLGDTRAKVRAEARRALALDPGNADALVELANVDESELDFARAREEYRRALALDPGNAAAHLDYSTVLPLTQAVAQAREAVLLDPQNSFAQNNLATYLLDLGDFEEMLAPAHAIIRLDPRQVDAAFGLAYAYRQLHRYDDMVKAFDLVHPQTPLERRQVEAGRLTYRAAQDATLRPQALAALNRLRNSEPGPDAQLNLVQLYLALDEIGQARKLLDEVCPAQPVDCSDLGVSPIYLPLRDDPGFQALAKKYTTITRE
ncbi:MAG TPA: tetratricopeptide repeat protein, partial [Gammaproteobacteria bacterium]|nr:tetratricopeptide repeat protein [Gammaproteobacteria bacterium]